jgi:hypothetical protein
MHLFIAPTDVTATIMPDVTFANQHLVSARPAVAPAQVICPTFDALAPSP